MGAKPYRSWRGALEFAGFPVNVALYSLTAPSKGGSFRQMSPEGNPIQQQLIDSVTGEVVDRASLKKGHAVAKDEFVLMSNEALEIIDSGTKTTVAAPTAFAPVGTVPWHLATEVFRLQPDKDSPGSGNAVNILWNGLRTGLAYLSQISLRGSTDNILAIKADDVGLW